MCACRNTEQSKRKYSTALTLTRCSRPTVRCWTRDELDAQLCASVASRAANHGTAKAFYEWKAAIMNETAYIQGAPHRTWPASTTGDRGRTHSCPPFLNATVKVPRTTPHRLPPRLQNFPYSNSLNIPSIHNIYCCITTLCYVCVYITTHYSQMCSNVLHYFRISQHFL